MARTPRFARAAKHNTPSGGKKSIKGNNRFGSRGCMKCDECRRRKTRCEFDEDNPHEPCRDCKRRGTDCGKTLPAQTHARAPAGYPSSLSPSPSEQSSATFGSAVTEITGREVTVESSLDNAPLSLLFENAKELATNLQLRNPDWTNDRILVCIRHSIAEGAFGDLRILLQPPQPSGLSPRDSPLVVQSKPTPAAAASYPAPYMPAHYPGPEMPLTQTFAGTVNPMTLTRTVDHMMPYNFTEALNEEDTLAGQDGFETMHEAGFEEAPVPYYNEMPFATFHPPYRYDGWQGPSSM